ncbi:MAG: hypothetical protein NT093_04545 [Candidatus Moranbacteria bacterium]|nr:hypothetical protein [Candidatus Moranbacteria bacterium]
MQGNSLLIVLLVVLILVITGLFLFWRMFFGFGGNTIPDEMLSKNAVSKTASSSASKKAKIDPVLVGTWESDCLVPDAGSPWSEKHQFIFNADGTAQHTRWSSSGHDCSPQTTMVDKYAVSTPSSGQIDFNLIEGTGSIPQDIYQVTGNTLLFGHGFRNTLPYGAGTLNRYIVYKKISK